MYAGCVTYIKFKVWSTMCMGGDVGGLHKSSMEHPEKTTYGQSHDGLTYSPPPPLVITKAPTPRWTHFTTCAYCHFDLIWH